LVQTKIIIIGCPEINGTVFTVGSFRFKRDEPITQSVIPAEACIIKNEYVLNDDQHQIRINQFIWDLGSNDWVIDQKGFYFYTITSFLSEHTSEFDLYPNPADSWLNIDPAKGGSFKYTVLSMDGSIVKEGKGSGQTRIMMQDLAPGSYVIRITMKNEIHSFKILR
jgi:hypothetical protein